MGKFNRSFLSGIASGSILLIVDPAKAIVQWLINNFHDLYQKLAHLRDTGQYKWIYLFIGLIISTIWAAWIDRLIPEKKSSIKNEDRQIY